MRRAVVVRPEPGNADTATKLRARGIPVLQLPLFAVAPVAWQPPEPAQFDAILLTSANAVRHGGEALATLTSLPVVAVGEATAIAARAAGFVVAVTGTANARSVIAMAQERGLARLLHLAGRERSATSDGVVAITVYASDAVTVTDDAIRACDNMVALLHSARAARRFCEAIDSAGVDRARIALATISPAVADAAGTGWASVTVAPMQSDDAMVADVVKNRGRCTDRQPRD